MTMTAPEKPQTDVKALHTQIAVVDVSKLPVLTRDRHIPRKEQAKLARQLFKSLGLKGISVTTPNYSMASTVHVSLPRLPWGEPGGADAIANHEAREKVAGILLAAFPNHNDRSDTQSDYFDYCWSFN